MSGKDISHYIDRLVEAGIDRDDARFEVRDMMEAASSEEELISMTERRAAGVPAAYILGFKDFYRDRFIVSEDVLIPRSDTEILVEAALRFLGALDTAYGDIASVPVRDRGPEERIAILDLCTGSGCVGLSVSHALAGKGIPHDITLTDISESAAATARKNAELILAKEQKVTVLCEDMKEPSFGSGSFDLIVSNPPYVNAKDMEELSREVRCEPRIALYGGEDGLDQYRVICSRYADILREGGAIAVEHGYDQGDNVRKMFEGSGLKDVMTMTDLAGIDRVTFGRK